MLSDSTWECAPAGDIAAHVLVFPFPAQGHLNCMLSLAELLVAAGLHVTFLHTVHNHRRVRRDDPASPSPPRRLRFLSIPDGLPDDHPRSADRLVDLAGSLRAKSCALFRDLLLASLSDGHDADGFPPVTCIIADGIMPFAIDVAEELGIPALAFRTASACSFWAYFCIPELLARGELPFPEGADLDEPVRGVPGMESFLRRRDLPSIFRQAKSCDDQQLQLLSTVTAHSAKARALILNTCECLESSALRRIRAHMHDVYAIGPLHAFTASTASLWREDRSCIAWLDGQPDRSVVYVSFGSYTVMSHDESTEFLAGLIGSGHRFLWVLRPDMIKDTTASILECIRQAVGDSGCVVGWAPQRDVLRHRAVGCFLTHAGWNSTLESVAEAVPMLCWPFLFDQQINGRFVSEVWKVGLDMKDMCDRTIVARMVREVMDGEKAAELRSSVQDMARSVKRSIATAGSSYTDLERLAGFIKALSVRAHGEHQIDHEEVQ